MEYKKLCKGCFREIQVAGGICPYCGFNEAHYEEKRKAEVLPTNTILHDSYVIGKCLGQGGFGITYIGWHINLEKIVAIKEFFPAGIATRNTLDHSARINTACISLVGEGVEEAYKKDLESFMKEARLLAKINLPNVVDVTDCFEENGTAYIVMSYVPGQSLKDYQRNVGGPMQEDKMLKCLRPVIRSLQKLHGLGVIHRDISPDNLMMDENGNIILVDFGAARLVTPFFGMPGKSMTVILKPGYAPIEQYSSKGNQGPWTDVYAMCATMFWLLTGKVPESPYDRMNDINDSEKMRETLRKNNVSESTAEALMTGMSLKPASRWKSMEDLEQAFYGNELKKDNPALPLNEKDVDKEPHRLADTAQTHIPTVSLTDGPAEVKENNQSFDDRMTELVAINHEDHNSKNGDFKDGKTRDKSVRKPGLRKKYLRPGILAVIVAVAVFIGVKVLSSQDDDVNSADTSSLGSSEQDNNMSDTESVNCMNIGDTTFFGSYEQDYYMHNGTESIEWTVLDVQGDRALLISNYGLDCEMYNDSDEAVSWEDCSLRTWLNNDFYEQAFSEEEKSRIVITELDNQIKDKVFLLNREEAEAFFNDGEGWHCYSTDYAKGQGAKTYFGTCLWWLRNSNSDYFAEAISPIDERTKPYLVTEYNAVRPALWIQVKS